jgi:hypothetical protein
LPRQKRELEVLQAILDGHPPLNGLLEKAVREYIDRKLQDPQTRSEFDRLMKPSLKVIPSRKGQAQNGER